MQNRKLKTTYKTITEPIFRNIDQFSTSLSYKLLRLSHQLICLFIHAQDSTQLNLSHHELTISEIKFPRLHSNVA